MDPVLSRQTEADANRILICDIPTRLFHWLLAASFIGAFAIANLFDDSAAFAVHTLLGGMIAFMVVLRVVWGFVGSRWSRFGEFVMNPAKLFAYLRGTVTGDHTRHIGHNPATSVAAVAIFALVLGLAATGMLMSQGEVFEELHAVLAWATVAVVAAHIAGVVWHTIRCRENIAMTMIDGRKAADASAAIPSARPIAALAFVALVGFWTGGLLHGYDATASTITVPLIGKTVLIGEAVEHGAEEGGGDHDDD